MDWEKVAKLSRDRLLRKQPTAGLWVNWNGKKIELKLRMLEREGKRRYYLDYLGRGISISEDEAKRLLKGDKNLLLELVERLRKKGRPYASHTILDLETPLDKSLELLSEYRESLKGLDEERRKARVQRLVNVATDRMELKKLWELADLLGWEELKQLTKEALYIWASEWTALESGTFRRIPEDEWMPLRYKIRLIYHGASKTEFYGWPKWKRKLDDIEIHGYYVPSGLELSVIAEGIRIRVKEKEEIEGGSSVLAGRREISLDYKPYWVAYFLLKHPHAAHDILEAILEEGEIPPEALLFHPSLPREKRQELLRKVDWRSLHQYVASPEDLDKILELDLPEDRRREIEEVRSKIEDVYKKIKEKLKEGYSVRDIHGILAREGWKEKLGRWWGVVYPMSEAMLKGEFYGFDKGREEETEGEGLDLEYLRKFKPTEEEKEMLKKMFPEYKKELEEL